MITTGKGNEKTEPTKWKLIFNMIFTGQHDQEAVPTKWQLIIT